MRQYLSHFLELIFVLSMCVVRSEVSAWCFSFIFSSITFSFVFRVCVLFVCFVFVCGILIGDGRRRQHARRARGNPSRRSSTAEGEHDSGNEAQVMVAAYECSYYCVLCLLLFLHKPIPVTLL